MFGHLGGEEGVRVDSDVQYSNSKVPGDSEVETKCYMRHSYFMQLRAVTLFLLQNSCRAKVERMEYIVILCLLALRVSDHNLQSKDSQRTRPTPYFS